MLVVGAGFAGSVIARELADIGSFEVTVVDQRNHVAGNAYDPPHPETGTRYHQYGPHIFHTDSKRVVDYLSRFTEWLPYRHRVSILLPNGLSAPMPINRKTINLQYGLSLGSEDEVKSFLATICVGNSDPRNAEEHLRTIYGVELTDLCFGRYTRKMWGLELSELPISVVARLRVSHGDDPYYFNDEYQLMPANGYLTLIENMLDHPNIAVELEYPFGKSMEDKYDQIFNSMPIDKYYENIYGPLPYRSIKFEHQFNQAFDFDVPTVNFTDRGPYTRMTSWALYPGCGGEPGEHVTYETPCSYEENNFERYYPIKTADGWPQARYKQYKKLADGNKKVTFIGRCGQYMYYDMHQVVANSLSVVSPFI